MSPPPSKARQNAWITTQMFRSLFWGSRVLCLFPRNLQPPPGGINFDLAILDLLGKRSMKRSETFPSATRFAPGRALLPSSILSHTMHRHWFPPPNP